MSKLLIQESPLQLLPSLATAIGLNEALLLQQMQYWLAQSGHSYDGRTWIYNTYEEWAVQFPFWSLSTVRRIIARLEELGILLSGNYNKSKMDRTKWYAIDYDRLDEVVLGSSQPENQEVVSVSRPSVQAERMDVPVVSRSNQETTQEITTETTKRYDEADERLVRFLFQLMNGNTPWLKAKNPSEKDFEEMNRMRRLDKLDERLIEAVIAWCQQDEFWKTNILSVGKLRKQFPRLSMQAKNYIEKQQQSVGVTV